MSWNRALLKIGHGYDFNTDVEKLSSRSRYVWTRHRDGGVECGRAVVVGGVATNSGGWKQNPAAIIIVQDQECQSGRKSRQMSKQ